MAGQSCSNEDGHRNCRPRQNRSSDLSGKARGFGFWEGARTVNHSDMSTWRSVEQTAPRAVAFFRWITAAPLTVLAISVFCVVMMASQATRVVRDTTVDAFMPMGHPALTYRDQVEDTFGLRDPVVVAVVRDGPGGIYTPETLALVRDVTDLVTGIANVDPEGVRSLATEKNIVGDDEGLIVKPFFEDGIETREQAAAVREAVEAIPLYTGTLVAGDGTGTLIAAELIDQQIAGQTYELMEAAIAELDWGDARILIAGEGAVGGFLSIYLSSDARKLQPLAFVIIMIVMVAGFRTWLSFYIPLVIITATAGGTMGLMGAMGVPYYIITAALPVMLIGVSVADTIHILSRYYEEQAMDPDADQRTVVVRAMSVMWRPVVLTSITTIAGFFGIAITSGMPPMFWFGTFASIGVALALTYSLIFLPTAMCVLRAKRSPAFRPDTYGESADRIAKSMALIGGVSIRNPAVVLSVAGLVVIFGVFGARYLQVDRARIDNFAENAPIYDAHSEINARFAGTNYLDFVIEAPEEEGFFDPERLAQVEALQAYIETLPNVQQTVSIVDYLMQMNKAMNGNDPDYYRLPEDRDLVAQYFLLYSIMGGPTDFQEEIDYQYRRILVRAMINEARFSIDKDLIATVETHLAKAFEGSDLTVNLSGRINVDYHWMKPLAYNHFLSISVSLLLVFIMSAVLFRSVTGGLLTIAPVMVSVLAVYAVMGYLGIWLEPATSMFASIAIGLGVDFAIHVLDRIRYLVQTQAIDLEEAMQGLYKTAGRALFLNFGAIFLGFSVLMVSDMPPLNQFGVIIVIAILINFLAAIMMIPALVQVLRPKFIGLDDV